MPYENSIRLLRIHKGNLSDPVEISLEFARLEHTSPTYEAISYVWGSTIKVSQILNKTTQTPIPVTRNLYEALKGVRKVEQDRVVWVDALCINQGDGKEKSTQVRKMDVVYTHAERVIVWLGADEPGDAAGAFGVLRSLANTEGEGTDYEMRSRDCVLLVPDRFANTKVYEAWRKVMMFFCQTWFTRLWVLQEIVLAQDALFVWGDCSISWAHVGAAINVIQRTHLIRSLLQTRNLQNAFLMWHLSSVCHEERISNDNRPAPQSSTLPFLHVLDISRGFEVTDPRDKIYGLLGLPICCDDLGANSIEPDYALNVAQVYTNVTRHQIVEAQNLDILGLVLNPPPIHPQDAYRADSLPSWVPNFNSQATATPISNINIGNQYTAGLTRPLHLLPSTSSHLLRLKGTVLDTIRNTGPILPFAQLHKAQQNLESLIQWYTDKGATVDSLASLLTCGRDREGHLLSPCQKEACAAFLSTTIQNMGLDPSTTPTPTQQVGPDQHENLGWRDTIHRFTTHRQPFLTATGRLGLGPQGLEEGDAIALLWGGQCPFALSRVRVHQWLLKGECYVQAWMGGDGVSEHVRAEGREGMEFEFV